MHQSSNHPIRFVLFAFVLSLIPLSGSAAEHGGGGKEAAAAYPGYLALTPPIVVNLASDRRTKYLKLDIQFYLETSHDAELVTTHMPLLRDRLINLLGGRQPDQLMSADAREQLRTEVLEKLRATLTEQTGAPAISALYFTDFIIQ